MIKPLKLKLFKNVGLFSFFPITATPGGLHDSLKGVYLIVAAIALIIIIFQFLQERMKKSKKK